MVMNSFSSCLPRCCARFSAKCCGPGAVQGCIALCTLNKHSSQDWLTLVCHCEGDDTHISSPLCPAEKWGDLLITWLFLYNCAKDVEYTFTYEPIFAKGWQGSQILHNNKLFPFIPWHPWKIFMPRQDEVYTVNSWSHPANTIPMTWLICGHQAWRKARRCASRWDQWASGSYSLR